MAQGILPCRIHGEPKLRVETKGHPILLVAKVNWGVLRLPAFMTLPLYTSFWML